MGKLLLDSLTLGSGWLQHAKANAKLGGVGDGQQFQNQAGKTVCHFLNHENQHAMSYLMDRFLSEIDLSPFKKSLASCISPPFFTGDKHSDIVPSIPSWVK